MPNSTPSKGKAGMPKSMEEILEEAKDSKEKNKDWHQIADEQEAKLNEYLRKKNSKP